MDILEILKIKIKKCFNLGIVEEDAIFYIAGSQTLPPPLPSEEEEKMLKKLELV